MASLFVDELTVIDFSYLDAQRGVVGESWIVDLLLDGNLNAEGMVFDFGHVKKTIKAEIDRTMDHTFVVPTGLAGLEVDPSETATRVVLDPAHGATFCLDYRAPRQAITLLDADSVTTEAATRQIEHRLRQVLPGNVHRIDLTLRPEKIEDAWYHYSHGLKKHAGDCQRMIHGHRSRIQVWRDGERWVEEEARIAENWRDIYLVTTEDIVGERQWNGEPCYDIAYRAAQGDFALTLPVRHCARVATDTTVELIADHLARAVRPTAGGRRGYIKAFEGVNKGAIAAWGPTENDTGQSDI